MPVKRRTPKVRATDVSELAWLVLTDERVPTADDGWEGYFLTFFTEPGCLAVPSLGDLWLQHGPVLLEDWVPEHPGKRLSCWWLFSAPRWTAFDPIMAEPRTMVGGSGKPVHRTADTNRLDLVWSYEFGIPLKWEIDPDPSDPPRFESQASYLDRHGLFLPGERKLLKAADFEPEVINVGA